MKYLKSFHQHLAVQRRRRKMTLEDIATLCQVDVALVMAWESPTEVQRAYPTAEQLIDLCLKGGMRLEQLIDLEAKQADVGQLQLPGFGDAADDDKDLGKSLEALQNAFEAWLPDEQERALLRRFRNADPDKQRFILQLIGP